MGFSALVSRGKLLSLLRAMWTYAVKSPKRWPRVTGGGGNGAAKIPKRSIDSQQRSSSPMADEGADFLRYAKASLARQKLAASSDHFPLAHRIAGRKKYPDYHSVKPTGVRLLVGTGAMLGVLPDPCAGRHNAQCVVRSQKIDG